MKTIKYIILIGLAIYVVVNVSNITDALANYLSGENKIIIPEKNEFYKNYSYNYVKENETFIPYSKQDLINIYYSILNNGYENFTYYCPKEYANCLKDTADIINDEDILTNINNFVSPYNNFKNIHVIYSSIGEVNVEVTKLYTIHDTIVINNKINEILKQTITEDMAIEDKILAIHDYIVNNTKYDKDKVSGTSTHKSNTAYGVLIEGYAICGGYADAMALFLNELNVPNFKVSSKTHIWNAVYLNEKWLHLDLTWDDPVTIDSDKNTLLHKFYLIDTEKLESYDIESHEFDKTIFSELS